MADNQYDKNNAPDRSDQTRSSKKQDAKANKPDQNGSGKPAVPPTP